MRTIVLQLCLLLSICAPLRCEEPTYRGKLISLDLQDADIRSVLRILSEASGKNIVAHRDVQGRVNMRLIDVPWDQVLDLLIKENGLYKIERGKVITLVPLDQVRDVLGSH